MIASAMAAATARRPRSPIAPEDHEAPRLTDGEEQKGSLPLSSQANVAEAHRNPDASEADPAVERLDGPHQPRRGVGGSVRFPTLSGQHCGRRLPPERLVADAWERRRSPIHLKRTVNRQVRDRPSLSATFQAWRPQIESRSRTAPRLCTTFCVSA